VGSILLKPVLGTILALTTQKFREVTFSIAMRTKLAYVGRGALNLAVVLAVVFGLQALIRGHVSDTLGLIVLSIALVVSYVSGVRWIERRQPVELLAGTGFTEFAAGLALGLSLFTTLMLLLWMLGVYRPSGWGRVAPLAGGLLLALLAAILEEIVFRGFLFRLSAKLLGTWGALALTSALFGAAHSFNRGATVGSSVAIALEAGVLLGAAYALTQRLWLPIGLHLGWNFAEGSIFGMSVSGGTTKGSLITGTLRGRDVITGGTFGPEASIVAVVICLAAALFLLWRTVRLGKLEPTAWEGIAAVQHPQA
jgi:membrane protease YdiL (CAAX protease family)